MTGVLSRLYTRRSHGGFLFAGPLINVVVMLLISCFLYPHEREPEPNPLAPDCLCMTFKLWLFYRKANNHREVAMIFN